jgi:hypothetical protein
MKLFMLAAAAALTIGAGASVPASAQTERVVTRTTTVDRHVTRYGNDRGWRNKRVCKVRWHHNRKVRTCRTIRVRR